MKDKYTQAVQIEGLEGAKSESLSLDGRGLYCRVRDRPFEFFAEAGLEVSGVRARVIERDDSALLIGFEVDRASGADPDAVAGFRFHVHPSPYLSATWAHCPKSVYTDFFHPALKELGDAPDPCRDLKVGCPGQNAGSFYAHYLEPRGSSRSETTAHPLLLPLVNFHQPGIDPQIALFAEPDRPWQLGYQGAQNGAPFWEFSTRPALDCKRSSLRVWWLLHDGSDAGPAYRFFHRYAAPPAEGIPNWLRGVRTHYYDFLSPPSSGGARGGGFEANAACFEEFSVGLATCHGTYSHWGDYIHPERKEWLAMRGDVAGPVSTSLDHLRSLRDLSHTNGARFAMYIHLAGFDKASPLWPDLQDSVRIDESGEAPVYPWHGPDIENEAVFMSIASEAWVNHLLQQVAWLRECVDPDAIVVDETFAGIGFDHHPERRCITSGHMIRFMKRLRRLIKDAGADKALLTSDCGLAPFALWADGEAGDCAYDAFLGQPAFRAPLGGEASLLGGRPWIPCAWQGVGMWAQQMDLARQVGAGVGLGNGWIEYGGFAGLPPEIRSRIREDINGLSSSRGGTF